jgi:mRNA interferase RelE/StbE
MPEARDDLADLDKPIAQRVFNRLRWLAENLDSITPEPLTGDWKGLFKFRIGSYRALYTINQAERRLTVHLIKHRREVYKKR